MGISWGVSPIAWMNDDMPELGAGTTVAQVLDDAHAIGFDGIELGHAFPRDPALLSPLLSRHALRLVGGWYGTSLLTRPVEAEIAALGPHLDLLQRMGSDVFVVAETSNAIHADRSVPLTGTPRLDDAGWDMLGRGLNRIAGHLAARDMRLAYHHHLGTVVETADDLERLFEVTDPEVGLTIDTGHAALAGIDPAAIVRRYPERILHVHCKDVRRARHDAVLGAGGSFLEGVVAGMFTVPGDGDLDFGPFLRSLAEIDYAGWIVVEAEQDPASAPPRDYQRLGLDTLRALAAKVGLSA
ncbi:myo-inosose-2 dehydratase [Sphingomonas sp. Leaf16]|nr:myo-inosose-2 dehydratase [Sphingomonas sp. Leaf16]KQN12496.1 myo-inosose-2 dehydratase [Sphingomonas sp. Leaf29]KQN18976.1 myo-inosose-2 dehydratase [Sphingomonas sp. Leaf32]